MSHLKGFSVSLQFAWIWFFLMLSSHLQLQYICYEVTISTWNNRGVYFFGPFNHFPTRLKILPHNFPGYYAQTPLIIVFTAFLSKNEFISAKFIEKCGGKMANIQYSFTKLENVEYLNNQNSYLKELEFQGPTGPLS